MAMNKIDRTEGGGVQKSFSRTDAYVIFIIINNIFFTSSTGNLILNSLICLDPLIRFGF